MSWWTISLVLFQNFSSLFFLAGPTLAQDFAKTNLSNVAISFDTNQHELTITGQTNKELDYVLTYSSGNGNNTDKGVTGKIKPKDNNEFSERVYLGSCSANGACTADDFDFGSLIFEKAGYELDFKLIDEVLWTIHDQVATVNQVVLNKNYVAPQNKQVMVRFNRLPSNPGSLSIEEVRLNQDQMDKLGTTNPIAYDITSDMEEGSFEYELKLPIPESMKDSKDLEVVYAESVDQLDDVKDVEEIVKESEVTVKNVNHFTVWIIRQRTILTAPTGTVNGRHRVTVAPGETVGVRLNVAITRRGWTRAWRSTGYRIGNGSWVCIDTANHVNYSRHTRHFSENFNIAAPTGTGVYDLELRAYSDDSCRRVRSSGYLKLVNAITVEQSDIIAPTTTLTSPQDSELSNTSFVISGSSTDSNSGVKEIKLSYSLAGQNNWQDITTISNENNDEPFHFSYDWTPTNDGSYDIRAAGIDNAGNQEHSAYVYGVIFDTTAPVKVTGMRILDHNNMDLGCGGAVNHRHITVDWDTNPETDVDHYDYMLREGNIHAHPTNSEYSGNIRDEDGVYKYRVRAVDQIGNEGEWSDWCQVTLDRSLPEVPQQTGYNENDEGDTNGYPTPRPINEFGCTGGITNINAISVHWTDVATSGAHIKYQRQYKVGSGSWSGNEIYTNPYTNYRSFGGHPGNENIYGSRVRAWEDYNDNNQVDANENVSNWSNECSITYDRTAPTTDLSFKADLHEQKDLTNNNGWRNFGWYESFDNVNLEVVTGDQGSDFIQYQILDGDVTCPVVGSTYTKVNHGYNVASQVNGRDGIYSLCYYGEDIAGNIESPIHKEILKIDDSRGITDISSVSGNLVDGVYYQATDSVDISFTSMDNESGIARVRAYLFNNLDCSGTAIDKSYRDDTVQTAGVVHSYAFNSGHLADGQYCYRIWGYDKAQNWTDFEKVSFVIDTQAPELLTGLRRENKNGDVKACGAMAKLPTNNPDTRYYPMWDDSADANFSHYEYSSFNAPNGNQGLNEQLLPDSEFIYTQPYYVNGVRVWSGSSWLPQEGSYGFVVRAVDKAGNKSGWALGSETMADSCQINYDDTAPTGTIDAIKYNNGAIENSKFVTNYRDPLILGTANDNHAVSAVVLELDGHSYGATITGNEWQAKVTDFIADGLYQMKATVTDMVGNQTVLSQNIRIDSVAPTASYKQFDGSTEVTGTVAYVNDVSRLSFTGEYSDVSPTAGLYQDSYVIFEAQDDGSFHFSQNGKKAFCSWRKEPNLVHMTGTAGDSNDNWSLTTAEPFSNCVSTLTDGEYYMAHQVYDSATRKDIPSINQFRDVLGLHFIVDTVAPTVQATASPLNPDGDNNWYISKPEVSVTASDDRLLDKVEYHWGTEAWQAYSSPVSILSEGSHTFYYRAYDKAGNVSDEKSLIIKWDKTAPEPGPTNLHVDDLSVPKAMFRWDLADDSISGIDRYEVRWRLKSPTLGDTHSETVGSADSEVELYQLEDGQWEIRIKAFDQAGNWTEASMNYTIGGESGSTGETTTTSSNDNPPTSETVRYVSIGGGVVRGLVDESNNDADQQDEEETEVVATNDNSDEGNVLGVSKCSPIASYLPLILLVLQFLSIVAIEVFSKKEKMKTIVAGALTLLTIILFFVFRNTDCLATSGILFIIAKWFVLIAMINGFLAKTATSTVID